MSEDLAAPEPVRAPSDDLDLEPQAQPWLPESMVFRELPNEWSNVLAGTWFDARNESHFGADRVRVPTLVRRRPLLREMGAGEVLILELRSAGCFHYNEYTMVLNGGRPTRGEVTAVSRERRRGTFEYDSSERTVAFTLSEDQAEAVDDALERYRGKPDGGCTTHDAIHADWRLAGDVPLVEYLDDGSCEAWHGAPSVFPLVAELLEGRPRGSLRPRVRAWDERVIDVVLTLFPD